MEPEPMNQPEENVEKQEKDHTRAGQSACPSCFGSVNRPIGGWPAAAFILGNSGLFKASLAEMFTLGPLVAVRKCGHMETPFMHILLQGMESLERLSFLGIGLNLVTYLHDQMQLPLPRSANIVTNFMGTSYLTCLLGGFIADTWLGRYKTIAIGCLVQLLGMVMLTLSVVVKGLKPAPCDAALKRCQEANSRQVAVLYIALYMIACGAGCIKSSVSGLGADQFEDAQEEGRKQMQSFFNWFGTSISAGGTLAITVLVYVQDNEGRAVGYAASAACMLLSFFIFLAGSLSYRSKPASGSAFTCIAHVLIAALRNRRRPLPATSANLFHHASSKAFLHSRQFSFLDRASLVSPSISKIGDSPSSWRLCSVEKVEEVKMVIRMLPILATTIVFWTANSQALTFSIEQAATLDRRLGRSFEIPPATFPVVLQLTMLITIPIYDRALIPLARKWRGNEHGITTLQRIGIGLLFSIVAMAVAALIENKRLHVAHKTTPVEGSNHTRLPMSIFYLTPQYALVGVGEAFAYVGQLDFFYRESPDGMRSLSTGLSLSTLSFGLFLSSALVDGINRWTKHGSSSGWLTNTLENDRLDYFYWFLSLLSFLSFLCYLLCSHWYKYKHTWFVDVGDRNKPFCDDKPTNHAKIADQTSLGEM